MVTKGTFKSAEQNYEPRYVLAIKKYGQDVGVCFFDVTTLEIQVGQFVDDSQFSKLRTLTSQIRPTEVLFEKEISESDVLKIFKNSACPPVFTSIPASKVLSHARTVQGIEKYIGKEYPDVLSQI